MISQMISLNHVSISKDTIIAKQTKIPKNGNSGKKGTLNGLGRLGWVCRKIITPAQTIIKAKRVPMDVICPNLEIGKNPAKKLTKNIKSKLERHGVRHLG